MELDAIRLTRAINSSVGFGSRATVVLRDVQNDALRCAQTQVRESEKGSGIKRFAWCGSGGGRRRRGRLWWRGA